VKIPVVGQLVVAVRQVGAVEEGHQAVRLRATAWVAPRGGVDVGQRADGRRVGQQGFGGGPGRPCRGAVTDLCGDRRGGSAANQPSGAVETKSVPKEQETTTRAAGRRFQKASIMPQVW